MLYVYASEKDLVNDYGQAMSVIEEGFSIPVGPPPMLSRTPWRSTFKLAVNLVIKPILLRFINCIERSYFTGTILILIPELQVSLFFNMWTCYPDRMIGCHLRAHLFVTITNCIADLIVQVQHAYNTILQDETGHLNKWMLARAHGKHLWKNGKVKLRN